ncbi:VOC family protein [Burkholderia alba]|uniref:VOC family protein n=1 Tax=Burkholderia alba TaxID=2683677 RepID=UPI002B05CC86|nr:VOC family protein [Burkholderia alba]
MTVSLTRLILYVQDVEGLKAFYRTHFGLAPGEEIAHEWAVLRAGAFELALHRAGPAFRGQTRPGDGSNAKLVFAVASGLAGLRDALVRDGVPMRELKRFDGFPYLLCDGEDPEGNVFQLMQAD